MTRSAIGLVCLVLAGCEAGEPVYEDGLAGRPAHGEWIEIEPGGDTVCSRGTPYRFFVRGGDPQKVIIDFAGGGACWNETTCALADVLFNAEAGRLEPFLAAIEEGRLGGLFDGEAERFFADWTIIHIPYCTGDIHWGNARTEYNADTVIEHRGYANATRVLDWVYSRYAAPSTILVSGCSAGAYGAALHSAYVADHYPGARISVFADSGAGIITDDFLVMSLPNWNAQSSLPPFIPALQRPLTELSLPDLYIEVGRHFPAMRLAQTGTAYDQDQVFYFTAMGGQRAQWPIRFRESLTEIETAIPDNFRSYVPPGSVHCVSPYPFFFTREVNGVHLHDWLRELVDGSEPPASQACRGTGCCDDPICAACAASGNQDSWCQFCSEWPNGWTECATP